MNPETLVIENHNNYAAINSMLDSLNVDFKPEVPHSDHFHITFKAPTIKPIDPKPKLLLADASRSRAASDGYAQGIDSFTSAYGNTGLVQVVQNTSSIKSKLIVLDICQRMDVGGEGIGTGLSPLTDLKGYLRDTKQNPPLYLVGTAVTVVKPPKFGTLVASVSPYGEMQFAYIANNKTWMGKDRVEFEVSYQGKTYKVINRIEMVRDSELSEDLNKKYYDGPCDATTRRIAYEAPIRTASGVVDNVGFTIDTVSAMLDSAGGSLDLSNIMLVFGDLADGAVGETVGEGSSAQITLDTTAAGHGWYIDATPLDPSTSSGLANSDYLPTSNPNIWQAKAGSEAAGKMDMLSVLLHEYGHALGLEHSTDSSVYMAATLQPGERRLSIESKGFFLGFRLTVL